MAEAQVAGDEEDLWTFSAQATFAILVASLTRVLCSALRQARVFNTAVPVRTVERGTQSDHNLVDSIVIPTSVYCSPGGEFYHTSRKYEGLQNVPMNSIRRRRSCMYCIQRDGRWNDGKKRGEKSWSFWRRRNKVESGRNKHARRCFLDTEESHE